MSTPPPEVCEAFSAGPDLEPLVGGQRTAWRVGDVVLKPQDASVESLKYQEQVLGALSADEFRVAPPLRSRSGSLVVDGWTAWPFLEGRPAPRWAEILAVGERLHEALAQFAHPSLSDRTDRWGIADRIAWGELPPGELEAIPEVAELFAIRKPVAASDQLIHGDLAGNVLFAEGLAPAIIDFSPYWRPRGLAAAIVVTDAVVWFEAEIETLASAVRLEDGIGLLVRALLFRLLALPDPAGSASDFRPAIDYVRQVAGARMPPHARLPDDTNIPVSR